VIGPLAQMAQSMAPGGETVADWGSVPMEAKRLRVVFDYAYAGSPGEPESVDVEVERWEGGLIAQAVAESDLIDPAEPGGTQLLYWTPIPLPERAGQLGLGRVDLVPRRAALLMFRDIELDTVVAGIATEVDP
jgi:hypothetical protein